MTVTHSTIEFAELAKSLEKMTETASWWTLLSEEDKDQFCHMLCLARPLTMGQIAWCHRHSYMLKKGRQSS